MRQALECARQSEYTPSAFCVGCVLATSRGHKRYPSLVVSTGYSRELPGNTHAEQVAIEKFFDPAARSDKDNKYSDEWKRELEGEGDGDDGGGLSCYTTMEPCSKRLSGNTSCVERIVALRGRVRRVFVACVEPDDFVIDARGTQRLLDEGIDVYLVVDPDDPNLAQECLKVARGQK